MTIKYYYTLAFRIRTLTHRTENVTLAFSLAIRIILESPVSPSSPTLLSTYTIYNFSLLIFVSVSMRCENVVIHYYYFFLLFHLLNMIWYYSVGCFRFIYVSSFVLCVRYFTLPYFTWLKEICFFRRFL